MEGLSSNKLHIAMFPWLALGHMIPFLELAKLIAQKGHRISFLSTPRNIQRLPKLPPNLSSLIHFVRLPLPHVDNLPDDAENTTDLPYNMVPSLKTAYEGLQETLTHFLQTKKPDWLIHDFTAYWLPPIAANLGIPNMFYSIFIAATLCYIAPPSAPVNVQDDRMKPEDFTVPPKWFPFHSTVSYRLFEISKIFDAWMGSDKSDTVTDIFRFEMSLKGSDVLAVRGCHEFEPQYLQLLEQLHGKTVIPVGQLPTTGFDTDDDNDTWRSIREWLDMQDKGSVVYVAFGSEAKPSQEEVTEIALGLELSQLPFFCVLRTRQGLADTELIELPDGFLDRTNGRGVVCTSWAPQLKILAHDSVGGFLTHSGWSSVVEAIQFERALILFTFLVDQGFNARVLEEKKIGYSIPRNERDGSFKRNSVADSLRLVLIEEEGKIYRDKVKEMKAVFGDRNKQDRYVDNLLQFLKTHKCHYRNIP